MVHLGPHPAPAIGLGYAYTAPTHPRTAAAAAPNPYMTHIPVRGGYLTEPQGRQGFMQGGIWR